MFAGLLIKHHTVKVDECSKSVMNFGIGIANFWKAPNEPNKSEEKIRVGNQWGRGISYGILTPAYMRNQS